MRVGISDKYLDKYYLPLVDNFDFIEYQVYQLEALKKLDALQKKCYVHLADPTVTDFLELVNRVSMIENVELVNIHARPFDEYLICKECGSRVYIYDPSNLKCPECEITYTLEEVEKVMNENSFDIVVERIKLANDILKRNGKKLSVENTFEPPVLMKKIMDTLPEDIGFTCDIGHAQLFYTSALDYISILRNRLVHLHIHDNFGGYSDWYHDLHISPGRGGIKWEAMLRMLRYINYQGTGTFESKATMNWVEAFRAL